MTFAWSCLHGFPQRFLSLRRLTATFHCVRSDPRLEKSSPSLYNTIDLHFGSFPRAQHHRTAVEAISAKTVVAYVCAIYGVALYPGNNAAACESNVV